MNRELKVHKTSGHKSHWGSGGINDIHKQVRAERQCDLNLRLYNEQTRNTVNKPQFDFKYPWYILNGTVVNCEYFDRSGILLIDHGLTLYIYGTLWTMS